MISRLIAVPMTAALLVAVSAPADSARMTRQDVGDAFILAMKNDKTAKAAKFVDAIGPGGTAAVTERPDFVYNGKSSWGPVTGAQCGGLICSAEHFPATPEPAWYVLKRDGRYRVVARAELASADYLLNTGTFGCLTADRKVRNRATDWNLVKKAPKGTPVWWVADPGSTNVAVDAGTKVPRTKMIYGYIPNIENYVSPTCGE